MYTIQLMTPQGICYLRGTIWTFQGRRERADVFANRQEAKSRLERAKKFMKAEHFRKAKIVEEVQVTEGETDQ
jgi:hypothetical protein